MVSLVVEIDTQSAIDMLPSVEWAMDHDLLSEDEAVEVLADSITLR